MKTNFLSQFIFFTLLLTTATSVFSQNEKNHWYFGQSAYINFNTPTPSVGGGSLNTGEGCATVSDGNGNLIFYTDGINVYDNTGVLMPNGTGLKGDPSSTHSALVVPNPCDSNLFYIFTTAAVGQDGMYVYTVDLSLNGGLGDVISNSETLLLIDATEKIAAVKHVNGADFWITTTRETTGFVEVYSWLVDQTGVSVSPNIFSSTHPALHQPQGNYNDEANYPGQIKFNSTGTLLAAAQLYIDQEIDIFSFDTTTGFATSFITAKAIQGGPYGIEFSPNGDYLYTTSYFLTSVYQLDITTLPSIPVPVQLNNVNGSRGGALQLSPDGQKIYAAQMNMQAIGAISNINSNAASYVNNDINLFSGTLSLLGLPTFVSGTQSLGGQCLNLEYSGNVVPDLATQTTVDELTDVGLQGKDKEFGDFDNDGDIDVLYTKLDAASNSPRLHVLINTAGQGNDPVYSVPGIDLGVNFSFSYRFVDWDNDGWNDVVLHGFNGGIYLCINDTSGGLNPPTMMMNGSVDYPYEDQQLISVGDLNQDNLPDLLISGQGSIFGTAYFENNGSNTYPYFTLASPQTYTSGTINNIFIDEVFDSLPCPEIYDADCDGDNDIFISDPFYGPPNWGGGRMFYHENQGGVTTGTIPNINQIGVLDQYGFEEILGNDLACDWVITRIVDFKGDDCPTAIAYNPCNDAFYYYDQDCSCGGILSVTENNINEKVIKLYPNPAESFIMIETENHSNIDSVAIYSFLGKELKQINTVSEPINISMLPSGIYFIKISSEGKTITKKIIKN